MQKIVSVSRKADVRYVPQLIALLTSDESYGNKRHAVRALGTLGQEDTSEHLVKALAESEGLMLGDICEALGRLNCRAALPRLYELQEHKLEWVRQKASWAVKTIRGV